MQGLGLGREGLGLSDHDFQVIQNANLYELQSLSHAAKNSSYHAKNGIGASNNNFHFIFSS